MEYRIDKQGLLDRISAWDGLFGEQDSGGMPDWTKLKRRKEWQY